MEPPGGTKKEATILELSIQIGNLLRDFEHRLDENFNRNIPDCGKSEEKPQVPNVLDEIIGQLEADKALLSRIKAFVSSEVLPKIN